MTRKYEPIWHWYEDVFEQAKETAAIIGIEIDDIYFSGFCCQGDGASFTGCYSYAKGASKRIRSEWPKATDLHMIADTLQSVQRAAFYRLSATIARGYNSNFYSHSGTMSVDVDYDGPDDRDIDGAQDDIKDALRSFADWIYQALEREYEYQCAWARANAWQELAVDAAAERAAGRQLIRDMRAARRNAPMAPASICNALRASVRRHLQAMADALREREELASDFWYRPNGVPGMTIEQFAAVHL